MNLKYCKKCNRYLSLDNFHTDKKNKDGKYPYCKDCRKKYDHEHNKKTKKRRRKYYDENKERIIMLNKKSINNNIHRYWALSSISNHKRNGFTINVSTDFLEIMAKKTIICPLCGRELNWNANRKRIHHNSPSLDRINNEQELNEDNVWIICYDCNRAKSSRTLEEFIKYCKIVVKNYNNQL